jgi:hypothetical protein
VTGQYTDLTLRGTSDHHFGLAGPHLLFDGDNLNVQLIGHAVSFRDDVGPVG